MEQLAWFLQNGVICALLDHFHASGGLLDYGQIRHQCGEELEPVADFRMFLAMTETHAGWRLHAHCLGSHGLMVDEYANQNSRYPIWKVDDTSMQPDNSPHSPRLPHTLLRVAD